MPTEEQVQGANHSGNSIPAPKPAAPAASATIPAPAGGHVVIRPLRTYKDDLAEAIKKGNLSKTSIALAEKDKREKKQAPVPPAPKPAPKPVTPHPAPTPAPKHEAPVAPKPVVSATPTPPAPPVVPPAPKTAPKAPVVPVAPKAPTPPHTEAPLSPAPEDAEGKRRFFENLLHVRRDEHAKDAVPETPKPQIHHEEPKPVVPPKSLAELLPKQSTFSVEERPKAPAPVPAPKPEPKPKPEPTPVVHEESRPEPKDLKDAPSFLPFWATPDGKAPVAEHAPEPVVAPQPQKPAAPLIPREDGPTRGGAFEEASSGLPVRAIVFVLGGIVLVTALGFGGYTLMKRGGGSTPPIAREFPTHLVTVTSTATIDITDRAGFELANAFYEEIGKVSSGKAVGIVFMKTVNGQSVPLTASEWFAQARLTPPGILVRSLAPSFAAGSYESHNGGNAFFVFETTSRDRALAGLLSWEKTLAGDMRPYLNTEPLPGATFSDRSIGGISVRIAGAGETALVYGMIDDRRIVITRGEGTFAGLVDSLPAATVPVQ